LLAEAGRRRRIRRGFIRRPRLRSRLYASSARRGLLLGPRASASRRHRRFSRGFAEALMNPGRAASKHCLRLGLGVKALLLGWSLRTEPQVSVRRVGLRSPSAGVRLRSTYQQAPAGRPAPCHGACGARSPGRNG